jgi:glycosyltransferase involved in cell wall biosynthesis
MGRPINAIAPRKAPRPLGRYPNIAYALDASPFGRYKISKSPTLIEFFTAGRREQTLSQHFAMIDALTLFEFWPSGHTPNFVRLIMEAWRKHCTGCLRVIVPMRFVDQHQFVFDGFGNVPGSPVRWVALDDADEAALNAAHAYLAGIGSKPEHLPTLHWELVERYGRRFPSRHMLLMNLDMYQLALSTGRPAPADFSGIFFLPHFYYRPAGRPSLNSLQERLVLRLLNHPQLRAAFFLDPGVADSLKGKGTAQVVHLPDPVRLPEHHATRADKIAARLRLGIPAGRKMFLFFGDVTGRKGLWELIDSLATLTIEEIQLMCLAIVGHAEPHVERRLAPMLEKLAATTSLSIRRRAAYVDEAELGDWFTAADIVLAPYVHHVGMSGILLLAAAYLRPVISQDFGAMGRLTRDYRLGLTVNPNDLSALAGAMRSFLGDTPPPVFDPEVAYALAKEQSREKFTDTLLEKLGPYIGA